MTRLFRYVGPDHIREAICEDERGWPVRRVADLLAWLSSQDESPPVIATYVIDADGILTVAPRRSEHVACAGGAPVRGAGELSVDGSGAVLELSNQSTGYCPPVACLDAVLGALDAAGLEHPGAWTAPFVFRLCGECGQRNIVKDEWFECDVCEAELPAEWNFAG